MTSNTILSLAVGAGVLAAAIVGVRQLSHADEAHSMDATDDVAKARELVETALKKYGKMTSYQDRMTMTMDMQFEGDQLMPEPDTQSMSLAFSRPDRVALKSDDLTIVSDGETLWVALAMMGQYVERDAPEDLAAMEDVDPFFPAEALFNMHPALSVMLRPDDGSFLAMGAADSISGMISETRNGAPGQRISGMMKVDKALLGRGLPDPPRVPFTVWISDETGLFGEQSIDATELMKAMSVEMPGMPAVRHYNLVIAFDDVRVDESIDGETFRFEPGSMDKVESFRFGADAVEMEPQADMTGETAPSFEGPGLGEEVISLADFEGRVVLLDFWATWCPPCVAALPEMQRLNERFAGDDFQMLGINQDGGTSARDMVRDFLKKNDYTITQVMDDGTIGQTYQVSGIPTMVLIDRDGTVVKYTVGFTPGEGDRLAEEIEKLLKE